MLETLRLTVCSLLRRAQGGPLARGEMAGIRASMQPAYLLLPSETFPLILLFLTPSDLHNGASIRGKLYTKKMHLDATVPFRRSVRSFVGRKFLISCSRLELFWTNFVRFVAHDRSFEISFDQQPNLAVPHNIRVVSFWFRRS